MAGRTNTDAIRDLERTATAHSERIDSLREEIGRLAQQIEDSPRHIQKLTNSHFEHREFHARMDERLKQVESRLERRWDLLTLAAGALMGGVIAFLFGLLARWLEE